MARHETLDLVIGVRVPAPQPSRLNLEKSGEIKPRFIDNSRAANKSTPADVTAGWGFNF